MFKTLHFSSSSSSFFFFWELGTKDMPTVTMRPSHLASNAPVVGNLISFSNSKLGDIP